MFPAFVLSSGGTRITLSGSGFPRRGDIQCRFGDIDEPFRVPSSSFAFVLSPGQLICNVPPSGLQPGEFGTARIFLATPHNDLQWTGMSVNYVPEMAITFVRPRHIDEDGGQSLIVGGNSFPDLPGLACWFVGGKHSSTVPALWISSTEVRCLTPPLPPGKVLLDMTFNGEDFVTAPEMLEVKVKLTIKAISPLLGPMSGGTKVTITGTGFGSAYAIQEDIENDHGLSCFFGDFMALAVPDSSERVECFTPPGFGNSGADNYGSVPVAIVRHNEDGTMSHSSQTPTPVKYLYIRERVLTEGKPNRGPSVGGTRVVLAGLRDEISFVRAAGLEPEFRCRFGSDTKTAIILTYDSEKAEENVFCVSPSMVEENQTVTVSVSLNGGLDFMPSEAQFSYYETPEIVSVSPSAVSVHGGSIIALKGRHFPDSKGIKCVFGSDAVYVKGDWVSPTTLACVSPPYHMGFVSVSAAFNGVDVSPSTAFLEYREVLSILSIFPGHEAVASGSEIILFGTGLVNSSLLCLRWRHESHDGIAIKPWHTRPLKFVNSTAATLIAPRVAMDDDEDVAVLELAVSNNGLEFVRLNTTERLTIAGRPRVENIFPRYGSAAGGVVLSIIGGGFVSEATSCRFGSRQLYGSMDAFSYDVHALVDAGVRNSTYLTCVTPKAPPGGYFVEVLTGLRRVAATKRDEAAASQPPEPRATVGFTCIPNLNVTSIEPVIVPESGGTIVAIKGSNLTRTGLEACRFGGTHIVEAVWQSSSLVMCQAPPAAPGAIGVELSLTGVEWTMAPVRVMYEPDRFVYSLSPTAGPLSGGSVVIVKGVGFTASNGSDHSVGFSCSFGRLEVSGSDLMSHERGVETVFYSRRKVHPPPLRGEYFSLLVALSSDL